MEFVQRNMISLRKKENVLQRRHFRYCATSMVKCLKHSSLIFSFPPPLFDRFLNNNFIRDRIKRHLLFFYDRVTVILTSQGTVIEKFSSQFSPEEHALFCVNVLRDKSRLHNLSGVIPSSGSTSTQPKVDF